MRGYVITINGLYVIFRMRKRKVKVGEAAINTALSETGYEKGPYCALEPVKRLSGGYPFDGLQSLWQTAGAQEDEIQNQIQGTRLRRDLGSVLSGYPAAGSRPTG